MRVNWHALRLALGLALAGAASACSAQPAAADSSSGDGAIAALRDSARALFELPATLKLDPPLRLAVEGLAQEQAQRMASQWPQWVAEERAANPAALDSRTLADHLSARLANEVVAWRIDRVDDAQDQVWLAALERTPLCEHVVANRPLATLAAMLQQMTPAQRDVAIAAERQLLARWGSAPRELPARPLPSAAELLEKALPKLRNDDAGARLPMWPLVADWLHFDKIGKFKEAPFLSTCSIEQW